MKCRKCGAMLRDTDVFCAQCGWKVEKDNRYPRQETLDIPIAAIEQNIIETTEKELGGIVRPAGKNYAKMKDKKAYVEEDYEEIDYEEIDYEEIDDEDADEYYGDDEDYEAIEDDDEDYDDYDDYDDIEDEDSGNRLFTIMIAGMAFLILAIAAFVGFRLIRNIPIRNYGSGQESADDEQEESDVWEDEEEFTEGEAEDMPVGTIVIQSNVNVRDNPSTETSQILKVAKAGEHYDYLGMSEDGSWYIVLLEDGSRAYIFREYAAIE